MVQRHLGVVTGQAAETFVHLDQQPVALARQQQAVGGGVEGFGELLFGGLQLLLGFFQLADVAYRDHQRRRAVELKGFGGGQPGEHLAIAAAKEHFQVADTACLQALEQVRADAVDAPDTQFGRGAAQNLRRA
ncbi:hypothetical protein D9M73_260890 [compost metagenome]